MAIAQPLWPRVLGMKLDMHDPCGPENHGQSLSLCAVSGVPAPPMTAALNVTTTVELGD